MRQIEMQVRAPSVETIRRLAEAHGDSNPVLLEVERGAEPDWRIVRLQVPNRRVGALVDAVAKRVREVDFVLDPGGTVPIRQPVSDLHEQVADVSRRSTLELVLDAQQSIGSWRGMLLYAFISGLVAAYGVIFDVPYLLTASMLIAPMGAPAMVGVIGVTLGDMTMIRRGTLRFFAALAVAGIAAVALGGLYGLDVSTATMEEITNLSSWAVLLAVAGGAAGAQALVRSDRDSLVTATATGFLVAVALSPPTAVLGLSVALGRGDYVALMAFNLLLTYFGILTGGWLSLRLFGVGPGDPAAGGTSARIRTALVLGAVVVTALLVGWQVSQGPDFRKADLSREAVEVARSTVETGTEARVLDARARFIRPDADWIAGEGLLMQIVVQPRDGGEEEAVRSAVRASIDDALRATLPGVDPFIDLSVVADPPS